MTFEEEIRSKIIKLLEELDELYEIHGHGKNPKIDTKTIVELGDKFEFIRMYREIAG